MTGDITANVPEARLTATPISRELQRVGQQVLATVPRLLEVEEGVFSNCTEPIADLGARLLRARDAGVPLLEVTTYPEADESESLQQLFGTDTVLLNVLQADPIEHHNDGRFGSFDAYMRYERLSLIIPGWHVLALDGEYGSEVGSVLETCNYFGYDGTYKNLEGTKDMGPNFGGYSSYENESRAQETMSAFLSRIL